MAMVAETVMHVGVPKLLRPASVNSWLEIFLSFVQRTTSHGAERSSKFSIPAPSSLLPADDVLECSPSREGDRARSEGDGDDGVPEPDGCSRDWNRRSNGLKDGEGEKRDPNALPANEDEATEP